MILHVVARPDRIAGIAADSNALFLPASIPAAMALREHGSRGLHLSDMLAPADFHEIWQTVITAVWFAIASANEAVAGPRILPIFGYKLALAFAQALVIGRWLDRARERFALSELHIEYEVEHEINRPLFSEGVTNRMYAEASLAWAQFHGIPCRLHHAASVSPRTQFLARRPWSFRRATRSLLRSVPIQYLRVLWALLRRQRVVLFMTSGGRLPPGSDQRPQRVATVLLGEKPWRFSPQGNAASWAFERLRQSSSWAELMAIAKPFDRLLTGRLEQRVKTVWPVGIAVYRYIGRLVRIIRKGGAVPVLLADCPFNDEAEFPIGFAADAVCSFGGHIAEFQHGGNYTLIARGFTPTILTTGLCDLFMEWNDVACREHELYGLQPRQLEFATVGCWSTEPTLPPPAGTIPTDRPLRLAYAPSLLSTVTLSGVNALWDDYLYFLEDALALLDQSTMEVDVSFLPVPEMMLFLSRRNYRRVRFHPTSFRRLAINADLLMADYLVSSPPYEAVMTNKPAIAMTGADFYQIDHGFLLDLQRRCITYNNLTVYLAGIRELVSDPVSYLKRHPRLVDPRPMLRYFSPMDGRRFWQAVDNLYASSQLANKPPTGHPPKDAQRD
jgi:hypothetical protein